MNRYWLVGLVALLGLVGCGAPEDGAAAGLKPAVAKSPKEQANQHLLTACQVGNLKAAQDALTSGADANAFWPNDPLKAPALNMAVNSPEIVEALLKAGASPTKADAKGMVALIAAAGTSQIKSVELLLSAGTPVDCKDSNGVTPLDMAVTSRKIDNVKLLLSHGAQVNAVDGFGRTPLLNLAKNKGGKRPDKIAIIHLLIDHGADIAVKDRDGHDALFYAHSNVKKASASNQELFAVLTPTANKK